jgi:hypothetical protein
VPRQSSARKAPLDSSPSPRKKPVKSSGWAGKVTAAFVAAAGLLAAAETFFNQAESLVCRKIWSDLVWCGQKASQQDSSSARSSHGKAEKLKLPSERFLPLAGALEPERWSKLSGNGSYQFVDGKLHAQTYQGDALLLAKDSNVQQDFTYSMMAAGISGPTELGFGLVFGMHAADDYFLFAKRYAKDYRLTHRKGDHVAIIIPWTNSDLITVVQIPQSLRIETEGAFVRLVADGHELGNVQLDREPTGSVGLFVDRPGLSVEFSDALFGPRR